MLNETQGININNSISGIDISDNSVSKDSVSDIDIPEDSVADIDIPDDGVSEENKEVLQEIGEILNREPVNGETSLDELLAIIAEIGLDKKEILNKIKDVSESEGTALFGVSKDNEVGILVGDEIITCVAKEDIDEFEKVTFATTSPKQGAYVIPTRSYSKKIQYKTSFEYDSNDNPIYIGEALPGTAKSDSKWRIKKLTYDSNDNVTDIETASGTYLFNNAWNSRTGYEYS